MLWQAALEVLRLPGVSPRTDRVSPRLGSLLATSLTKDKRKTQSSGLVLARVVA